MKEAKKRGLPNIHSTVEALGYMNNESAVKLFERYKILTREELHSRYEIYLEQYAKHINIEALTAIDMVKRLYIPVVIGYTSELAKTIARVKATKTSASVQAALLGEISDLLESASKKLAKLEAETKKAQGIGEAHHRAEAYRDKVFTAQADLRKDIDALEQILPTSVWPVPTYADMLFKL